jgi:diguanylate cyclase (GGDEF)-like protein
VRAEESPYIGEPPRDRTDPTGWRRARLGVVVPLCIVVTAAIACVVIAALTSANRADEVAVEHEQQLLSRALTNHGAWSLRRLRTVVGSEVAVNAGMIDRELGSDRQQMARWLDPLRDHDLVVVVDSSDNIIFTQRGSDTSDSYMESVAVAGVRSIVGYLRGRSAMPPDRIKRLLGDEPSSQSDGNGQAVYLQNMHGQLSVLTVMPINRADPDRPYESTQAPPLVMTLRLIEENVLSDIGERLQLVNLRMLDSTEAPPRDHVYPILDDNKRVIVRFAWTPQQPGAEIFYAVIPFIIIAFAGFALLAALLLRYLRYTAATIAAGEDRLRYLALHDPLCGLPNRNFFSERLEAAIEEVRNGGAPVAVLYIDLDHFKDVNDTLGHPIGDELIRNATLRLSRALRSGDLVARLGGDEFAVITSDTSEQAALQAMAANIISTLCTPFSINGYTIVIGASIGIAVIDHRFTGGAADIMRYADMALYRAKNEGRNRACIYDAVMDADLSQRKLIEQDLREAIESNHLKVLFQPIVNASGEKIVAVEALARWPHPTRGLVTPSEFIPIAEHSGLIIELGARVLRRACIEGKSWPGINVAVNVSPLQFRQRDFVSVVERILGETGFDPKRLELELTETTLLGNVDSAEAAMRRLKALGVQFALDDFGTGYSSLHYLRRFPFDKLKIDRTFVLSIEKAADAAAIVHAVVSLGRGLGMKVTAEGVETADQHLFLRAAGVHFMQGFRFGAPSRPEEISKRIVMPGVYRSIKSDAAAIAR